VRAALASAIDVQALRVDQLSAAIVHATSQVTWSGRAAEKFRIRAAERSRECLQLALALRTSAERVNVAAMAPAPPAEYADQPAVPEWRRGGESEADRAGRTGRTDWADRADWDRGSSTSSSDSIDDTDNGASSGCVTGGRPAGEPVTTPTWQITPAVSTAQPASSAQPAQPAQPAQSASSAPAAPTAGPEPAP